MVTFILLALVASLPIIAYLLANQTSSKGIILGITVIVLSLCLIFFISKFSILGTFEKQTINNKIIDEIYLDKKNETGLTYIGIILFKKSSIIPSLSFSPACTAFITDCIGLDMVSYAFA